MLKKNILVAAFFLTLFLPLSALSVDIDRDPLGVGYGQETGLARTDPRITVARIIQVSLSILGTLALILIIYSGFLWMTAAGNDDQISKAKSTITAAIIGLVIILSAYAISTFVIKQLYKATTGQNYLETP